MSVFHVDDGDIRYQGIKFTTALVILGFNKVVLMIDIATGEIMKKYFSRICFLVLCIFPIFASASSKGEQCKYITEAMLEIAAQGASDEALEKLKSKEVHDKAYTTCMSGTDREVGELYKKLQ